MEIGPSQGFLIFERKILKMIFGSIRISDLWRRRAKHKLYRMFGESRAVRIIKLEHQKLAELVNRAGMPGTCQVSWVEI